MYEPVHFPNTGRFVGVRRLADGVQIPRAEGNRDWQEFLTWNATADPPVSTADLPPPTAEERAVARRLRAAGLLLQGTSAEQTAIRAADVALWTFGRNDVAEYGRAVLEILFDELNVTYPSEAEIAAKIQVLRNGYDPGVTPQQVADRGGRRLMDPEVVALLQAVLLSGAGDPRPVEEASSSDAPAEASSEAPEVEP